MLEVILATVIFNSSVAATVPSQLPPPVPVTVPSPKPVVTPGPSPRSDAPNSGGQRWEDKMWERYKQRSN